MRPFLVLTVIFIALWLAGVYMVANGAPTLGGDVCRVGGAGFGVSVVLLLYKRISKAKAAPPHKQDDGR